ncbi:MAG: carboxylating nicotinate-nucleotide diphosphorylase [FCB group bacterium]|nr:carboxylating nicotinate-nucleotide diphosphorylase [FCB group bacterium]
MPSREKILQQQVSAALLEDVGAGDITSLASIDYELIGVAEITAKSDGVICGLPLCEYTFLKVDSGIEFKALFEEGQSFKAGDQVAMIMGRLRSILIAERTALNFLMRLSGVATLTHRMVMAAGNERVKILDTRKTTPGLRFMEKYAVATGGGENHRYGLYDMVLIKDNHIAAAGSVADAIGKIRDFLASDKFLKIFHTDPAGIEVEIEVESIDQLQEALDEGITRIMLDNKSPEHLAEMVSIVRERPRGNKIKLEASGNVTLDNIADIAASGVDFISVGALTHSAPASDFSLKLLEDE